MSFITMMIIIGVTITPSLYARVMPQAQVIPPTEQKPQQVEPVRQALDAQKNQQIHDAELLRKHDITKSLDTLLQQKVVDDAWYPLVSDLVIDLAIIDKQLANDYFQKIRSKTTEKVAVQLPAPVIMPPIAPPPVVVPPISAPMPLQPVIIKNEVVDQLNNALLKSTIDDAWYDSVNDLLFDLATIDKNLANQYLQKIHAKITQAAQVQKKEIPVVINPQPAPQAIPAAPQQPPQLTQKIPTASKAELIAQLNDKLRATILDEAWYTATKNLLFDLALFDRGLSDDYLEKVFAKNKPVVVVQPTPVPEASSHSAPMKKGTPPPPPGAVQKPVEKSSETGSPASTPGTTQPMKKGTPPAPPASAQKKGIVPPPPPMKAGGTPPPPPGPMIKGKKAPAGTEQAAAPPAPKAPLPLSIKESYSVRQLEKRSNDEVVELFNKLLEALAASADFWDAVKKEAKLEWKNKIDTVAKALADPKRSLHMNTNKQIEDRIKQVKEEKTREGAAKQAAEKVEEKIEQQQLSQEELIKKVEAAKRNADVADFKWLIRFQGAIKDLAKVNHAKALEYETEFITQNPDQKKFLPKAKAGEAPKELTGEEKLTAVIDKILAEKPNFWAIKVREPIQELYDINADLGLRYQDKYLSMSKQVTGKDDKPFLNLKK
jgi:hypothetical protein